MSQYERLGEEPWKDVGIFNDQQWNKIARVCLVYMSELYCIGCRAICQCQS